MNSEYSQRNRTADKSFKTKPNKLYNPLNNALDKA